MYGGFLGIIKIRFGSSKLTLNGSACSHEIGAPHDTGLILSGSDSGTASNMKSISNKAMAVAKAITKVSL